MHPNNARIRSRVQGQSAAEADTEMECGHEVGYRSDTGEYKERVGGNEVNALGIAVIALGSVVVQRHDHWLGRLAGVIIVITGCYLQNWERWMK